MKALLCKQLTGISGLAVETIANLEAGPNEIVIRVKAAGLNFFDTLIISGKYQHKPELPFSPGTEIAGIVTGLGRETKGFALGDRVTAFMRWGALREEVAIPANRAIAIPYAISFETAAVLQVAYGTALYALRDRAQLKAGETLAVLGAAGGTGQAAIELGKIMGARVIAVASSEEKLEFCRSVGADRLINSGGEDVKERIREETDGHGVDVIFDSVGGPLSGNVFRAIAWGGRHLVIGFAAGAIPELPLNLPLLKGASIVGVFWGEHVVREWDRHRANMGRLFNWLRNGQIRPHIDYSCRLEDAKSAFALIGERRIKGKAVVVMD
jgi:NADPH2:quinone reductase